VRGRRPLTKAPLPLATHHHSTLCLNSSNHPLIPPEGLVLIADVPTPVDEALVPYLRSIGVQIQDAPRSNSITDSPSIFLES
jgi:hypothetical protein